MIKKYIEENRITLVYKDIDLYISEKIIDYINDVFEEGCRINVYNNQCQIQFEDNNSYIDNFIDELNFIITDEYIEEIIVEGLEPIKVNKTNKISIKYDIVEEKTDEIIQSGPYQGQSVKSVIDKFGDVAVVELMRNCDCYNAIRENICYNIKCYTAKYKEINNEELYNMSLDAVKSKITIYKKLLKEPINNILQKTGYMTLEDFLKCETEVVIKSMYKKNMKCLYRMFNNA